MSVCCLPGGLLWSHLRRVRRTGTKLPRSLWRRWRRAGGGQCKKPSRGQRSRHIASGCCLCKPRNSCSAPVPFIQNKKRERFCSESSNRSALLNIDNSDDSVDSENNSFLGRVRRRRRRASRILRGKPTRFHVMTYRRRRRRRRTRRRRRRRFIGSGQGPVRDFGTERALVEPLGPNTGNFQN